jgi:hypothetical protein
MEPRFTCRVGINSIILEVIMKLWDNPTSSATCISQTRDKVPEGAFFRFVSKGFSEAIRLSETGVLAEIGL